MKRTFHIKTEADTLALAQKIAPLLSAKHVLLLHGDLGAGKSCFCRGLINALSSELVEVPSPTFTLVQEYDTPLGIVWHMDLYRLNHPEEVYELGWEEALGENLLLIEWPSRLKYLTPKNAVHITLTLDDDKISRIMTIEAPETAHFNLAGLTDD